jgi:ethanolamine utilization microcompartment shell protein EutS
LDVVQWYSEVGIVETIVDVDTSVVAPDAEEAKQQVRRGMLDRCPDALVITWRREPVVVAEELPTDQLLRHLDAPALPGL